jgi:AICAR transformylase/IMP cyclohydrolase PurH
VNCVGKVKISFQQEKGRFKEVVHFLDSFFPFDYNIEVIAKIGLLSIIQNSRLVSD